MNFAELLAEARAAHGVHLHTAPGCDDPHAVTRTRAASYGVLRLSESLTVPAGEVATRHLVPLDGEAITRAATKTAADELRELGNELRAASREGRPFVMPGNNVQTIAGAVVNASLVASAGARIIPISAAPDADNPEIQTFGQVLPAPVLFQRPERFSVITAAKFAALADGAEVAATAFPAARASVLWGDAPSHAVRFELSRAEQKSMTEEELAFEVEQAIARGLARLADSVLLNAIAAATPAAFTLAAAAAKGLRFAELRALVGTAAAGAAVGADGVLRASGITAEFTDTTAATIVGAFNRAAVAVEDEVPVIVDRTSLQGDLAITAHASMRALLPDAGAFFKLTAA
jgi:hypothetical protein